MRRGKGGPVQQSPKEGKDQCTEYCTLHREVNDMLVNKICTKLSLTSYLH